MRYTAKYGHLEKLPELKENQIIKNGQKIGRMGNSGKSTAKHLHFDLIRGFRGNIWRLSEIEIDRNHAIQSSYFIDDELFKTEIEITSYYCDPDYKDKNGELILHPAYDVVPENRHRTLLNHDIFWNRSMPGQVLDIGNDSGYGYYCLVGFDA
jgi:murein DD-endopeptidase MepM/ murein hydrolase activator NlpD